MSISRSGMKRNRTALVFQHLTSADKARPLREIFRVLQPGGELHILDFGKPPNALAVVIALGVRRLERTADNLVGKLPEMMQHAGFADVAETVRFMSVLGTLALYRARKASA